MGSVSGPPSCTLNPAAQLCLYGVGKAKSMTDDLKQW